MVPKGWVGMIQSIFFPPTVTYRGRRDADPTVVIGSRATGTASCLVLLLCYFAGFHTATGQGRTVSLFPLGAQPAHLFFKAVRSLGVI